MPTATTYGGADLPAVPLHAPPPVADWLAALLGETLAAASRENASAPPQPPPPSPLAREIAASVARFLDAQGLAFSALPEPYLYLLAYRGLCAAGERHAAAADWAARRLPGLAAGPNPFDPAVWPGAVPLSVWTLFDSGLVRPVHSIAADGRILWMLDFRRLHAGDGGWLELTLLPGLRALVEQLAPAWDSDGGRGVLGLRGLFASGFAPTTRRRRHSSRRPPRLDAATIRSFCVRLLARQALQRRWTSRPDVLYLDYPSRPRPA